jgi:hypothetical protein
MLMCFLNTVAVIECLVAERKSVTKISQAVISVYGVSAVGGNTDSRWALRIASSEKCHAGLSDGRSSLWLANNSSQGLFHSERQTAYNQQVVTELTIQGKFEQQYRCLGIFESVCMLGYNEA